MMIKMMMMMMMMMMRVVVVVVMGIMLTYRKEYQSMA